MKAQTEPKTVASETPGYTYGAPSVARSPLSVAELEQLKQSVAFTADDERYLRVAGDILADRTKELVTYGVV